MASLSLCGVARAYPAGGGLLPLDLEVPAGDRLAILGPSGSGKSTLLRVVAGLEPADAGRVFIGGVDVTRLPPHRRGVGLVPQKAALYPHLTVREHLVPLVPEFVEMLRVGLLLDRYPHELSGGERQRVSLARVAARQPGVWLLDEPFAPLDPVFRAEFRADLHLLLARVAATMVIVTHDPIDALALGRRVGVLGDGRLQQLGTPEELARRPGNRFVAFAVGRFSFLDGVDGTAVGIRPEDVYTGPAESAPDGIRLTGWPVVAAEPAGGGWLVTVTRGRNRMTAAVAGRRLEIGESTDWVLPRDKCEWFDGTGRRTESTTRPV